MKTAVKTDSYTEIMDHALGQAEEICRRRWDHAASREVVTHIAVALFEADVREMFLLRAIVEGTTEDDTH